MLIDVIGSKGGVGTTTAAVNLASALVDLGKQVALVDMNLMFGEVPVLLNMNASFHWGEIVRNISRLDSSYLMGILSKHASGLYVLPSPPELDGFKGNETSAVVDKLLRLMQGMFDFVIVDGGHSLDDTSLKGLEVADSVFLVTELSLPCLTNVKKLLVDVSSTGISPRGKYESDCHTLPQEIVDSAQGRGREHSERDSLVYPE